MFGSTKVVSFILSRTLPFCKSFHSISADAPAVCAPGGVYDTFVRYNIRNHFPRPSERKRIKVHGWKKRMSTPGGQRVIMRRILKGCHVYSH